MRTALLAIAALSLSTPAFAESRIQEDADEIAEKLNDPVNQAVAAGALGAMMDAVLDMRIDGMAKALEPLNRGRPIPMKGRTVRELAERDDPYFEEKMQRGTRQAIGSMGALASALAVALPEFEAAMRKMEGALPPLR